MPRARPAASPEIGGRQRFIRASPLLITDYTERTDYTEQRELIYMRFVVKSVITECTDAADSIQ